jgi:hypothetical protein
LEWSELMGASARCVIVPLLALLLTAASLEAQDPGLSGGPPLGGIPQSFGPQPLPVEQPVAPLSGDGPPVECPCPCLPSFRFEADWLFATRAGAWSDTRNFINGPDAASFTNLPAFTGDNGYRLTGEVRVGDWIFEAAYSHYGDWQSSLNTNVNGVAFNAAAAGGKWAGENAINASTFFTPIFNAASQTAPTNTAADQTGLGPSVAFPADAHPALLVYSHSIFFMTEANAERADYFLPIASGGMRLGFGFVNASFNDEAFVSLSGTFRDFNAGGTTVSLPNAVLTSPTAGDLTLYSGGGSGFSDGVSNGGTGTPSQLRFTHQATTRNELNGGQIVLDWDALEINHLDFTMRMKAGIFDNFAQGTILETYAATNNDLSSYYRQYSADVHHLAFLGGVGVNGRYHFTDEVSASFGYEALFLSNLALGQEQILGLSNNWYHVQTNGSAVIQAVNLGVEIAF